MAVQLMAQLKQTGSPPLPNTIEMFADQITRFNLFHQIKWIKALALGHSHLWTSLGETKNETIKTYFLEASNYFEEQVAVLKDLIAIMIQAKNLDFFDRLRYFANHTDSSIAFYAQRQMEANPAEKKTIQSIFVVDDSMIFCKTLARFIEKMGFEVGYSHKALEAAVQIQERQPDLVLMDYFLGDVTGVQLARDIVVTGYEGKLIFITSSRDEKVAADIRSQHDAPILYKPFPFSQLLDWIKA
ncbi:MAG: response regulator [Acidobacteria bacterium]|nr:response regulator [Acidobacteriota bacterium]